MIGSYYASVKLFYANFFRQLTDTDEYKDKQPFLYHFFQGTGPITFPNVFSYLYIGMCCLTVLVSIAVPIDRAMCYFYVITIILSILTIAWIVGLMAYLVGAGFYPTPRVYVES